MRTVPNRAGVLLGRARSCPSKTSVIAFAPHGVCNTSWRAAAMNAHAPKILSDLAPFHIIWRRPCRGAGARHGSPELAVRARPKHSRDRRVLRLSKLAATEAF